MNYVGPNNLSLKYQRFTPSDCQDKEIRKFEFVTKTQFLYISLFFFFRETYKDKNSCQSNGSSGATARDVRIQRNLGPIQVDYLVTTAQGLYFQRVIRVGFAINAVRRRASTRFN